MNVVVDNIQAQAPNPGFSLQLSALCRRFGTTQALQDITLTAAAGDVICLVGHSGCGKTSLLRIISGVDRPDNGTLIMGGKPMVGPSHFVEPENRKIGVVFQDYALFPHLTVLQNVLFGLRRTDRTVARKRARELIDLVGLTNMEARYPHMLSGGEQQRVALARALAPNPSILLMDEPFSNLDRGMREKVRTETMALLRHLGTTVVLVTHDAEEALSTGDLIVLMKSGKIIQTGTAHELYDQPNGRYAADFFCNYNVIPGKISKGCVDTALGCFCAGNMKDCKGGDVAVYVRPQDIHPVLGAHSHDDLLAGRIETRTFLGEAEELTVGFDALSKPLRIRTTTRLPANAQNLPVRIDRDKALIFSA